MLSYISDSQTEYLIIDLYAIYEVDTFEASSLYKMDKSISLLGTKLILTGIKSTVAIKLMDLEITFGDLKTFKTVQDALEHIIQHGNS
ncbi:STAS domain-containing protein [Actinomycetes bacterium NPDC127524]